MLDKPEIIKDDEFVNKLYKKIEEEGTEYETYKILQISDWHVDFRYREGANRYCKDAICCQV